MVCIASMSNTILLAHAYYLYMNFKRLHTKHQRNKEQLHQLFFLEIDQSTDTPHTRYYNPPVKGTMLGP